MTAYGVSPEASEALEAEAWAALKAAQRADKFKAARLDKYWAARAASPKEALWAEMPKAASPVRPKVERRDPRRKTTITAAIVVLGRAVRNGRLPV